jgi:hypothetical protein
MMPDDVSTIMIAGDWHGNTRWAVHAIHEGCSQLDGETKLILQLGDFGIWCNGHMYLEKLSAALEEEGAELFFIDGNHEDFTLLRKHAKANETPGVPFQIAPRIWYLPRGWRWKWHGRTWLALGGAASVDRAFRTEGHSWFREEEITLVQAGLVALAGPADVMITHECPRRVTMHLPLGDPYPGWDLDVSRSHQELLDRIIDHVEPSWLFHGHMHLAHQGTFTYPHGKVQVRGLNCDGRKENWAILDTKLMAWEEETP